MTKDELTYYISSKTDKYFSKTKTIVLNSDDGDSEVVYCYFLRSNSLYAPLFVKQLIDNVNNILGYSIQIIEPYKEGDFVLKEEPLFFLKGKLSELSELETLFLQRIGIPSSIALTAYKMNMAIKYSNFIAMGARHYSGAEMNALIDYGTAAGSKKAQKEGALGFIGTSTDDTSKYFGTKEGIGTMPHSLIGYFNSTLKAAVDYRKNFSKDKLTVLVDYFGKELTDSLEVCTHFKDLADKGELYLRLDTPKERYLEGLDNNLSIKIIDKYHPELLKNTKNEADLSNLIGTGVSLAAVLTLKEFLYKSGFPKVKIIVSSGFNLNKCILFGNLKAPVSTVGTGSLFSSTDSTIATADIVSYNGSLRCKKGRERLIEKWQELCKKNG